MRAWPAQNNRDKSKSAKDRDTHTLTKQFLCQVGALATYSKYTTYVTWWQSGEAPGDRI
jgi:hypothetical protein